MKNKEVTKLINKMKKCYGMMDFYLKYDEVDLLVNHIEQLENNRDKANKYLYFIIPTINGEIDGKPYIFVNKELLKYIKEEVTIYKIDTETLKIIEVKE